ncbi:MAG: PEP/pyruvate-binding domain-containing protein, partial [Vicinamibacteria bacterium]
LPNVDPSLEFRLDHLLAAVKAVYASTYTAAAKRFLEATQYRLEEEKMAVIIQRVVGRAHGSRFYPDFSGVARSYNFYPTPPARSEDGLAALALGLGETLVEGGPSVRFSPRYPRHLPQGSTVQRTVKSSQREFYAIQLGDRAGLELSNDLRSFPLDAAEEDGTLAYVASTYSHENDALYDGVSRAGVRVVTFAPILKHGPFPLAEILDVLLEIGAWGTRSPVELEVAVNLPSAELGILPLRPLALTREIEEIDLGSIEEGQVVCRSASVLGHGKLDDIRDAVMVDRGRLERGESRRIADIVARLNAALRSEGRNYVLIGAGRWGSAEPFLGIPVTWDQISAARVIVEAGFREFHVTPSQGTHFFQNLMSNNVGYFTVNPEAGEGFLDWSWLRSHEPRFEAGPVRHLRFDVPMVVKMNGKKGEGAVFKPGEG